MLIQYLVYTKPPFEYNKEPKYLTPNESISEVKKSILASRVRKYIERKTIIAWGQCTPGLKLILKEK